MRLGGLGVPPLMVHDHLARVPDHPDAPTPAEQPGAPNVQRPAPRAAISCSVIGVPHEDHPIRRQKPALEC
jgi:hypothetical protein